MSKVVHYYKMYHLNDFSIHVYNVYGNVVLLLGNSAPNPETSHLSILWFILIENSLKHNKMLNAWLTWALFFHKLLLVNIFCVVF